jgi:hypothetical protein
VSSYDYTPRGSTGGSAAAAKSWAQIKAGLLAPVEGISAAAKPTKPPPAKTVNVRAHTRTIPVKPKGGSTGGGNIALGPSVTESTTYKPPATTRTAPAKIVPLTQSVRPSESSNVKRYKPSFPKEPVAGYDAVQLNPDGSLAKQGNYQPGVRMVRRPYYTNTNTLAKRAGPAGQESTQWNAATVAQAKQMQVANYGGPAGYAVRSLIPGGLDQSGTTSVAKALVRGAEAASTVLPGGGVGEAAGILTGLRGLKVLRGAKDVAEAAPAAHAIVRGYRGGEVGSDVAHLAEDPRYAGAFVKSDAEVKALEVHATNPLVIRTKDQMRTVWQTATRHDPSLQPREAVAKWARAQGHDVVVLEHGVMPPSVRGQTSTAEALVLHPERLKPATQAPTSLLPAPAPTPAEQLRTGLKGARGIRAKQEAGYSAPRGSREAQAQAIYSNPSLSVAEREHAANAVLRGALPKVYFDGFKDLTPGVLEQMKTIVMEHPTLRGYDKKTLTKALDDAHAGEVPTNSELDKLETVFGKATRDSFAKYATDASKWKDAFYEVGNIPRSLMSSVDISGVGRQGLGALVNHPIITGRNLPGMIRAANHEAFYQQGMKNLAARPNAGKYEMGKLAVTNLEGISNREEAFASNLAEKLTGLGKRERSPVRWSARAYTYMLAHTRADIYDHYDRLFANAGQDVHDPKFIKGLSTMINSLTGRGFSLGGLAHGTSGKALNTVLFSPKLMASRFDLLNPVYYAKMPKGLRPLALRHSLATVGAIASTLELARLSGLHVGLDPRSADFAKIKVGNTRIDLAAGYQQTVRMLYQVAVGQSKSSATGQVVNLRSGKYGQKSVTDVLTNFFENKESPLASITSDYVLRGGKNTIGQKMTPGRLAGNYLTPLLGQDLFDIYREKHGGVNGLAWALGAAPLGAVGVGLQTYGPPKPKQTGGSSSGGSSYDYTPSGSGGGSSYDYTPSTP